MIHLQLYLFRPMVRAAFKLSQGAMRKVVADVDVPCIDPGDLSDRLQRREAHEWHSEPESFFVAET